MGKYPRKRKTFSMKIPLTGFMWIPVVLSFPTGPIPSNGRHPSSQLFAFPWFGESPAEKKEFGPASPAENCLSENLSDAANIMENFKTSQRIGERTGTALQELSYTFVDGMAADGKVKVTFNGQQIPIGVEVDETYLEDIVSGGGKEGVDELCLALITAMQDAHYKSGIKVEEKMKSLYSDLEFESE